MVHNVLAKRSARQKKVFLERYFRKNTFLKRSNVCGFAFLGVLPETPKSRWEGRADQKITTSFLDPYIAVARRSRGGDQAHDCRHGNEDRLALRSGVQAGLGLGCSQPLVPGEKRPLAWGEGSAGYPGAGPRSTVIRCWRTLAEVPTGDRLWLAKDRHLASDACDPCHELKSIKGKQRRGEVGRVVLPNGWQLLRPHLVYFCIDHQHCVHRQAIQHE